VLVAATGCCARRLAAAGRNRGARIWLSNKYLVGVERWRQRMLIRKPTVLKSPTTAAGRVAQAISRMAALWRNRSCHERPFLVGESLAHSRCRPSSSNGNIRARSKSMPARPYIARLSVFSLMGCLSVCPLLQGSSTALRTASISCRITLANRRRPHIPDLRASCSQTFNRSAVPPRSRPRNRIARRRIVVNSSDPAFSASTLTIWQSVS